MPETYPTDADLNALSGTTDSEQEVLYIPTGESPYYTSFYRMLHRLLNVARRAGDLRVFKDGDLTFGVRAGKWLDGNTLVEKNQADEQSLTDGQTNYIYYTAGGTLTVSITGWPTAAHIPLATIVTSGGVYSIDNGDITDYRGATLFRPIGISASCTRAAVKAWGAIYFTGRPADDELLTIGGRKYEMDSDGDFPQASGDVQCDLSGNSTVDDDITDIAAAINGDSSRSVDAVADTTNDVLWLYATGAGDAGNSITLAEALTNATVSNATLVDGADAGLAAVVAVRHTITAGEAAGGFLRIATGLSSIEMVQVTFEDAGNEVASQVDVTVSDGNVTLAENGAAWATDDVLNILIIGTE